MSDRIYLCRRSARVLLTAPAVVISFTPIAVHVGTVARSAICGGTSGNHNVMSNPYCRSGR